MSLDAQAKVRNLMNELQQANEHEVHWLTQLLADYMNVFPFIGVLIMLMLLDIATGLVAAMIKGEINSICSFKGVWKKVQMLLLVASGLVFEVLYPDIPWGKVIAGMFSLGEMISILENAGRAGIPIPNSLKETLARLKSSTDTVAETSTVRIEVLQEHKDQVSDSKDDVELRQRS